MVETTEVDDTTLKVIRDDSGQIEKCIPLTNKEEFISKLEEIAGVDPIRDTSGVDIWITDDNRIQNMNPVFKVMYQHNYVPRSGDFDRNGCNSDEKPGFMYAMAEPNVRWR